VTIIPLPRRPPKKIIQRVRRLKAKLDPDEKRSLAEKTTPAGSIRFALGIEAESPQSAGRGLAAKSPTIGTAGGNAPTIHD